MADKPILFAGWSCSRHFVTNFFRNKMPTTTPFTPKLILLRTNLVESTPKINLGVFSNIKFSINIFFYSQKLSYCNKEKLVCQDFF